MRLVPVLFCVLALLGLNACSMVTTSVAANSAIPADITPRTVYITPGDGADAASLGWQTNARTLAGVLLAHGFATVPRRADARLIASFAYSVDDGRQVTSEYRVPERDIIGYRTVPARRPGPDGTTGTRRVPVFGVVGYEMRTKVETVFTRRVTLDMTDARTGRQVFEARGISRGPCAAFTTEADAIFGALLKDFPQARTGNITIKSENGCTRL
ncbi:DUF4136 domain-containing protein [Pseudooceanicola sediminis]|uniref:DUF4136 domain-containing protein n=1 Tax=Pseudooceanicola sediminis TaxID=2211117 RepID=A0A399J0Q9_9RHOB|nr:DUF4136 domain-containing protein [Pseudooceanicola sediminis]KAA2315173.1 DUF4136 domain-containing protein [Puniceibacterium sp. HSS470]RII39028.1 DUF4136 domain-containing protein [Pseudooceanicola sediminis]|tara:strand:+ start:11464 stop:12105 length:642 start_codon:yes stop_codon:yes gene_type:complete